MQPQTFTEFGAPTDELLRGFCHSQTHSQCFRPRVPHGGNIAFELFVRVCDMCCAIPRCNILCESSGAHSSEHLQGRTRISLFFAGISFVNLQEFRKSDGSSAGCPRRFADRALTCVKNPTGGSTRKLRGSSAEGGPAAPKRLTCAARKLQLHARKLRGSSRGSVFGLRLSPAPDCSRF